jgi:pantothenate kinase
LVDAPGVMCLPELCARARTLAAVGGRTLLGITGAPGAGKSTLGRVVVEEIGLGARLVAMDGFHLSRTRLAELGRLDRKGAPDTFDVAGLVALVRRLRDRLEDTSEVIYAPEFRRDLEEPIAGAIAVEPDVRLVVVEGNYLLIPEEPWSQLHGLFDEVWYCETDEATRLANLIARHQAYGKSQQDARRWALGPDQRNAELIATTRPRADVIARIDRKHHALALGPAQARQSRSDAAAH